MLRVNPVSRAEIDGWEISGSGLPTRVVNSVRTEGLRTIGELRKWSDADLLRLRSLGRISLSNIHSFFSACDRIEAGEMVISEFREVLDMFLDRDEYVVLTGRYGLLSHDVNVSRNFMTLQAIGTQENKTRERIRQIEENAAARLRSKLGMVCLQPFYDYYRDLLNRLGKTADPQRIAPATHSILLSGYNPCAALLLLCDLDPGHISFIKGFFTTLPVKLLEKTEVELIAMLEQQDGPLDLFDIIARMPQAKGFGSAEAFEQAVRTILDHAEPVAATNDNRYFLYSQGMTHFLTEVMQNTELPAHFRNITAVMNDKLKPRCRKGAGFVLEALNAHPRCTRLERGIYDLVESRQPFRQG